VQAGNGNYQSHQEEF